CAVDDSAAHRLVGDAIPSHGRPPDLRRGGGGDHLAADTASRGRDGHRVACIADATPAEGGTEARAGAGVEVAPALHLPRLPLARRLRHAGVVWRLAFERNVRTMGEP